MKMNVVLMIIGGLIFAVGVAMTFTKAAPEDTVNPSTTEVSSEKPAMAEVSAKPSHPQAESTQSEPQAKDDSKSKGNDFEDYVANILKANSITIKEWNKGTVTYEGAFGENALNPDMFAVDKETKLGLEYWIECKFRSYLTSEGFKLDEKQLERYKRIQKSSKRKILIALGLGGEASSPERFFIIPLDSLVENKHIQKQNLADYQLYNPKKNLKEHVRNYFFKEVFKNSKK
ncbi:MAG: hypothetical protein HDS92_00930 [Bacteroidales bacterium]|nr:hypothetical protein [Bacteroidales bacterium]